MEETPKVICERCQEECEDVKRRRLCSQYADEEANYMTSCLGCFEEIDSYYQELWDEFYASRL